MVERWKGSATAAEEEESVEATNLHLMNLPEIKRYMLKMRMLYKKKTDIVSCTHFDNNVIYYHFISSPP